MSLLEISNAKRRWQIAQIIGWLDANNLQKNFFVDNSADFALLFPAGTCSVYSASAPKKSSKRSKRSLYKATICRHVILNKNFVIVITGEDLASRAFAVIPCCDLSPLLGEKLYLKIHIPTKDLPQYNNITSMLSWWKYMNHWELLF